MNVRKPWILFLFLSVLTVIWVFPNNLLAQAQNGISNPEPGDVLSGIVIVEGTASDPRFLRYEVAFFQEARPQNEWIVFAQGDQPVLSDTLAVWDTMVGQQTNPVFPDGRYQLRLRVVRTDYNYEEYHVRDLTIANLSATPSPTTTITTTVEVTPTPLPGTLLPGGIQPGDILPSLTPFPTPSPPATPENIELDSASDEEQQEQEGLLAQLSSIDTSSFGRAFLLGVTIVAVAFAGLALYFLLRGIWRWFWRSFQSRRYR